MLNSSFFALSENKVDGNVDDICFKMTNDRGVVYEDDEPKMLKKGQMGVLKVTTSQPIEAAVSRHLQKKCFVTSIQLLSSTSYKVEDFQSINYKT